MCFGRGLLLSVVVVIACRGQHADHAGLRAQSRRFDSRLHPDEADGIFIPQGRDRRRRGRVACHHDDPRSPREEEFRDRPAAILDERQRLLPVRTVGVVGVVDITFLRKKFYDLPEHGQPAGS